MMFFLGHGHRVIAHDRRGHGRSAQVGGVMTWTTTPIPGPAGWPPVGVFRAVASGPFYGFNRPDAEPSEPAIQNW
jgi:pimeloyl-ACP methyl ester carboxylesterase